MKKLILILTAALTLAATACAATNAGASGSSAAPIEAAELFSLYTNDYAAAHRDYGDAVTVTGIITYVGTDIHGTPSFRLSDRADGACLVHACLASRREYGSYKVGDRVTVTGHFHILSESEWGVVLKGSRVVGGE